MDTREEFRDGLKKYAKLELLWVAAMVFAIGAYISVPVSIAVATALFFLGGFALSAAGLGCAYTIAKENI